MTKVLDIQETHQGKHVVVFVCDNCHKASTDRKSHYDRKQRHFCGQACYSEFRKNKLPKEEHNRFGTGFSPEEQAKRRKARSSLNHYMRDKGLERQPCEICGAKAEAHHDNYDKPLEVRWLCFKHHRSHHKAIYENPALLTAPSPDKEDK